MKNVTANNLVEVLSSTGARVATKYVSPCNIIRATRRAYKGKFKKGNVEIILTMGKPNFAERRFIAKCKKAREPFPVKKIQLKFLPGSAGASA